MTACKSSSAATTVTEVTAMAKRGDLTLDITAVGNLSYSTEEELSFDTGGTVAEVLVKVGDSVTKGQVLARLDLTEWQENITNLESTLASKQLAVTSQQQKVASAERQVAAKERAVTAAEQALETAQYNLTVKERAVTSAQLSIEQQELSIQQKEFAYETRSGGQWIDEELVLAKKQLELTKAGLTDALREVEQAKLSIQDAETAIEDAKLDVEDAKTTLLLEQANLAKAQQDVINVQKALEEAKATSPEITAPFDGLVTAINTAAGHEVLKGGAIVTLVDPLKYKAVVSVGETDIINVQLNGDAVVELDALPGTTLPAKVTYISPTATTSSGVVSYNVTVQIDSEGVEGLKQGLTATVSIIIQQAKDAILIPSQAVSYTSQGTVVTVLENGNKVTRAIKTGISDSKYTVVTEGITEGEQVVYSKTTTASSTSTTSTGNQNQGGIMIPMGNAGGAPAGGPPGGM